MNRKQVQPGDRLTKRELQITRLVCQEKSNAEIGQILEKSKRTIDFHRDRIRIKTGAHNSAGLVIWAIKNRVFSVEMVRPTRRKYHEHDWTD